MTPPRVATDATNGAATAEMARAPSSDLLVASARAGDRDAFATFYSQRVGAVSRYIGAILRDVDRTEDVTAQTFLRAWNALPRPAQGQPLRRLAVPDRAQRDHGGTEPPRHRSPGRSTRTC